MTATPPAPAAPAAPAGPLTHRQIVTILIGLMMGMFLAALDQTIVATSIRTIADDLKGLDHQAWATTAYLITSTVTVPVWGKLSDLYGRRRLYQVGIGVFLLGSVLSGLSQSMGQLVASRAVQGLGAGALVTLSMTIIADIYTVEERTRMQGFFSGVWGVASILGPVVGGFITDQLSWRWVFFINLPVGMAAAAIIGMSLLDPLRAARPPAVVAASAPHSHRRRTSSPAVRCCRCCRSGTSSSPSR